MKIRPSISWACVAVITVLALVIWFAKRSDKTLVETSAMPEPETVKMATVQPTQREAASPVRTNAQTAATPVPPAVSASPPPPTKSKKERMSEALAALNDVPIIFYGKLEDQFGNPVAGAEITGNTIIYNGRSAGTSQVFAVSDANGLFKLDAGRGESLGVMPRKAGYALASSATEFKYSELIATHHVPDLSNPVVMKMWKLQGTEPLAQINQRYKLRFTDAPVNFDLLTGKIVSNGGDVKITVSRTSGVLSLRNPQDWSLKIEAVDGGIMTSAGQERVTYWAPENGYEPSETFIFSTNPPYKWSDGFTEGFFVMSRKGQVYSKLGVSFSINRNPDDLIDVTLEGVANVHGSRNWEGDPNTFKP